MSGCGGILAAAVAAAAAAAAIGGYRTAAIGRLRTMIYGEFLCGGRRVGEKACFTSSYGDAGIQNQGSSWEVAGK